MKRRQISSRCCCGDGGNDDPGGPGDGPGGPPTGTGGCDLCEHLIPNSGLKMMVMTAYSGRCHVNGNHIPFPPLQHTSFACPGSVYMVRQFVPDIFGFQSHHCNNSTVQLSQGELSRRTAGDPYNVRNIQSVQMSRAGNVYTSPVVSIDNFDGIGNNSASQIRATCSSGAGFAVTSLTDFEGTPNTITTECVCACREGALIWTGFENAPNISGQPLLPAFWSSRIVLFVPGRYMYEFCPAPFQSLPVEPVDFPIWRVNILGGSDVIPNPSICPISCLYTSAYALNNPHTGITFSAGPGQSAFYQPGWSGDTGLIGGGWPAQVTIDAHIETNAGGYNVTGTSQSTMDHIIVEFLTNSSAVYRIRRTYGMLHPEVHLFCGLQSDLIQGGYHGRRPLVRQYHQTGIITFDRPRKNAPAEIISMTATTDQSGNSLQGEVLADPAVLPLNFSLDGLLDF